MILKYFRFKSDVLHHVMEVYNYKSIIKQKSSDAI